MEKYEKLLLKKLNDITKKMHETTLFDKIVKYIEKGFDKRKEKILNLILIVLNENKLIDESPFNNFKNKICQILYNHLNTNNYNYQDLLQGFLNDDKLGKLLYFSGMISIQLKSRSNKNITPLGVLFRILNEKDFELIKQQINEFQFIKNNEDFINLILFNDKDELENKLYEMKDSKNNTYFDLSKYVRKSNEEIVNYINDNNSINNNNKIYAPDEENNKNNNTHRFDENNKFEKNNINEIKDINEINENNNDEKQKNDINRIHRIKQLYVN